MEKEIFEFSSHLGFNNPFYFSGEKGEFNIDRKFEEIVQKYKNPLSINPAAVTSVVNKFFILGNQTLVRNIYRTPWMAHPDKNNRKWFFHNVPPHQEINKSEKEIADNLFHLLCEEIEKYVKNRTRVGVLLSGGMDSRMLAGCLNYLILQKRIDVERVVAFTWGLEGSRDVEYSRRIAEILGWSWRHFPVNSETLWNNILLAGERGCEFSGLHLHAMPLIAQDNEVDVFLAGSYGDSIGRAEYSGKKVANLIPIGRKLRNPAYLLKKEIFFDSKKLLKFEVEKYHLLFPRAKQYMVNEVDYQLHYMRRMLNPCMEVINEKVPIHQIFTDPKVFGFAWSLSLDKRNDTIYAELLKHFPKDLGEIPWARTGKPFRDLSSKADNLYKNHHNYEQLIQGELLDRIEDFILQNRQYLMYINSKAVLSLIEEIRKFPKNNFDYLERICWVTSYVHFLKKNEDLINIEKYNDDHFAGWYSRAHYFYYTRGRSLKKIRQKLLSF